MLNGSALNSLALNARRRAVAGEPQYVVRGISYGWRLRLLVDGVDMTAQLSGATDDDRSEGGAGVAGFALRIASGPVVPTDWIGRPVTLDYITSTGGVITEERRYTGRIIAPVWDARTRMLNCECSDQLQQRVESLPVAEIDALTGGFWTLDVFDPVEGRSRWDYALERMSTRTASLDCSPAGDLRVTSWYAGAPVVVFGPGTTLDGSVSVQLPELSRMTNTVEIEASYRYTRLRQRNESFSWTGGGFCGWYFPDTKELPTISMVEEAVASAGAMLLSSAYDTLPPSDPDPCAIGIPWVNIYTDLLLGASFTVGRRWAQPITESYTLTLQVATSVAAAGEVVERIGGSFEVESTQAEAWAADPFSSGDSSHTDERDEPRRQFFLTTLLSQAKTSVVSAHRGTVISWDVPTSMALGIDLTHTLELNDQGVRARGKCCRVADSFDLMSGQAITTLSIAVMRGGGTGSDSLAPPPSVDEPQPGPPPFTVLPTQIGGRIDVPEYDDELPGFAGNWAYSPEPDPPMYPRRFDVQMAEIPAELRDDLPVPIPVTYQVAIPDDLLEL